MPAAHFDQSNVALGLANTAIACPPMSEELLRTYLEYFVDSGYLPSPAHADTEQAVGKGQQ